MTVDLVGQGTNNEQGSIVILGNNKVLSNNSEYSFGDVVIGNGTSTHFDIINSGIENLQITDIEIAGDVSSFSLGSNSPTKFTLTSNQRKRITAHFKPTHVSSGYFNLQIRIHSNDISNPIFNINLYGFCIEQPQYSVYYNTYGNRLLSNNSSIGKGRYNTSYKKYVSEITIVNTGNTVLKISNISLSGTGRDLPELDLPEPEPYLLQGQSTTFRVLTRNSNNLDFISSILILCENAPDFNICYVIEYDDNDDGGA